MICRYVVKRGGFPGRLLKKGVQMIDQLNLLKSAILIELDKRKKQFKIEINKIKSDLIARGFFNQPPTAEIIFKKCIEEIETRAEIICKELINRLKLLNLKPDDELRNQLKTTAKKLIMSCSRELIEIYIEFTSSIISFKTKKPDFSDVYNEEIKKAAVQIDFYILESSNNSKDIKKEVQKTFSIDCDVWDNIKTEYDITKVKFSKKISFVKDSFKKKIIFRDIEQAYILSNLGFNKPAVILAGSVIEELLRLYLIDKKITPINIIFYVYIKSFEHNCLLKTAIHRLTDSVRYFRNLVHLEKESTQKHSISKSTAKGAVSSIFTIANDF